MTSEQPKPGPCKACGDPVDTLGLYCKECYDEKFKGELPKATDVNINFAGEHGVFAPPYRGG